MGTMLLGLRELLSVQVFLLMNLGVLIGIFFGALPGLSGMMGIILFLPLTYSLEVVPALLFLTAIFVGSEYGGSITAILIGTPGTNAAAATMMDGHPLARSGKPNTALRMALVASTCGGIISSMILLFAAPPIAEVTIECGPAEFFAIAVFGLSIIVSLSGENVMKGMCAGFLGVFLALVGADTINSVNRFTFGNVHLIRGMSLMTVLGGVFIIPSIVSKVQDVLKTGKERQEKIEYDNRTDDRLTLVQVKGQIKNLIRSSLIGTMIGAIPGPGDGLASFISYDSAQKASKEPERFGKGSLDGICASEAANNAVVAGCLIPLFTLGIPGSPSASILIGAFQMKGMQVGPALFDHEGVTMYAIMLGVLAANIFMYLQGKYLGKLFSVVTKIPNTAMAPILICLVVAGAYAANKSLFDVQSFAVLAVFFYIMYKLHFPQMPICLGYILGSTAEYHFRRALTLNDGNPSIFVTRPISLAFLVLTVVMLFYTRLRAKKGKV